MLAKDSIFIPGIIYLVLMFILQNILPSEFGRENGVIENLQLVELFCGIYLCYKMAKQTLYNWGGHQYSLWLAGTIYFFLLIMREINWGRALLQHPDGSFYEYSEMGLYGALVHPLVAALIILELYLLYKAKLLAYLQIVKIPVYNTILLLIFIFLSWLAEKGNYSGFNGSLSEELAEFGAYMMMLYLLHDSAKRLLKITKEKGN